MSRVKSRVRGQCEIKDEGQGEVKGWDLGPRVRLS
jgi:hypothetical protein